MTFAEQVKAILPEGHELIEMSSASLCETVVETVLDGVSETFSMAKLDLSEVFAAPPVLALESGVTYNDILAHVSNHFGFGWEEGIDYGNKDVLALTKEPQYVRLEMSPDSLGYKGVAHVLISDIQYTLSGDVDCNLVGADHSYIFFRSKLRTFLCSRPWTSEKVFYVNRLSQSFIDVIMTTMEEEMGEEFSQSVGKVLIESRVVQLSGDHVSDIVHLEHPDWDILNVRFTSKESDLPDMDYFSKDVSIVLDDGSKELSSGEDEDNPEKPSGKNGEKVIYGDYEVINHNPSLLPKEHVSEEKEETFEEMMARVQSF